MAVVARAGQALGRNRPVLSARRRLEDVKQPEANGLLDLVVAAKLHIRSLPELVQVGPLLG